MQRDCRVGDYIRWLGGLDAGLEVKLVEWHDDRKGFDGFVLKEPAHRKDHYILGTNTDIYHPNIRKLFWEFADDFEMWVTETREKHSKRRTKRVRA